MLRHRAPWGGIAVFVLALLVRLFYLHEISDTPLFATPVVDARTYVEDARYLANVSWSGRPARGARMVEGGTGGYIDSCLCLFFLKK